SARRAGFDNFDFTERLQQGLMTSASKRWEYYPGYFVEPYQGNENALGFDLATDPVRRAALDQSVILGQLFATSRVTLVQDHSEHYGVLVFRPVYQGGVQPLGVAQRHAKLIGFVLGVFRINDIMETRAKDIKSEVQLVVFDDDATQGLHLLYPRQWNIDSVDELVSRFRQTRRIIFAGRSWTIVAVPKFGAFESNHGASTSILVLGLLVALLWSAYLRQMLGRQVVIEQEIKNRTIDLNQERDFGNAVFNSAGAISLVLNREGEIVRFNTAAELFTGYQFNEIKGQPFIWERFMAPEQRASMRDLFRQFLEGNLPKRYENRWQNRAGESRLFDWSNSTLYDDQGLPKHLITVGMDITLQKHAEEALRESQTRLDLALRSANMGVWSLDLVTNKRHFDNQQCFLLGINSTTFKGSEEEYFRVIHPDDREIVRAKLARTIEQDVPYESEFRAVWPDGSIHYIAARGRLVRDDQDRPLRINGVIFEITEWKEAQNRIHNLAFYDPLTGLPNRRLLTDRLQQALVSSARNGLAGAILFIDLDNFKTINDTLGHALGDALLQQTATRLISCVREEDTVARIGGDEFVVMLEHLSADEPEAATQTESIGMKILAALSQPCQIASHECRSTCSIGITLFNGRSQSTDELLKQADIAMYQAKKAGRNALRFFDTQMQEIVTARATLEGELRKAIENQQFQLYYQIQVDSFLQPIGAEALIRWNHPDRGLVLPAQFIALAEETGLILPMGQWVLETACAQLKAWEREERTRKLVLAVNVSAREFRQADFVAQVQATIQRHAIQPYRLKLELTESLLLENIEDTVAIMNALNDVGIQFSLDDFGTGYSSLQYLKRLPINQIK
ncbi:MAG: diguanylate cyclase, partial [Ferrovum sp.]|nr:diguanylate cyclase [Ferrovum sp.]